MTNIITATITAYCACKVCCGPNAKGITASGRAPIEGRTIAASRAIPFGSRVSMAIKGQTKTFIVEDRLAKRFDSRFDIYFASHQDAWRFGKRTNVVTIITP